MEEVVMVIYRRQRQVSLQHDDVRVVDQPVRSFMLRRQDWSEENRGALTDITIIAGRKWCGKG